jgi:hypothetical protein
MGSSQFNLSCDLFGGGWLFFLPLHSWKCLKGLDGVVVLPRALVTHPSIESGPALFGGNWTNLCLSSCILFGEN